MHKCEADKCEGSQHEDIMPASGKKFTFREPTMGEMKTFMNATPILQAPDAKADDAPEVDEATQQEQWERSLQMVCTLSVTPKFTDGEKEIEEGEALLDDVVFRDVVFMIDTLTEASGLGKAKKEADPT